MNQKTQLATLQRHLSRESAGRRGFQSRESARAVATMARQDRGGRPQPPRHP